MSDAEINEAFHADRLALLREVVDPQGRRDRKG